MKDEDVVACAHRRFNIDAAQGVMACAGNMLARVLVGVAYIDQHGTVMDEIRGILW